MRYESYSGMMGAIDDRVWGHSGMVADAFRDVLKIIALKELCDQYDLNSDDMKLVHAIVGNYIPYLAYDIFELIGIIRNDVRERSHGAVSLSKVYIPTDLYKNLRESAGSDFPDNVELSVTGVVVRSSDALTDGRVLALCQPKFKYVEPQHIAVLGRVRNATL